MQSIFLRDRGIEVWRYNDLNDGKMQSIFLRYGCMEVWRYNGLNNGKMQSIFLEDWMIGRVDDWKRKGNLFFSLTTRFLPAVEMTEGKVEMTEGNNRNERRKLNIAGSISEPIDIA